MVHLSELLLKSSCAALSPFILFSKSVLDSFNWLTANFLSWLVSAEFFTVPANPVITRVVRRIQPLVLLSMDLKLIWVRWLIQIPKTAKIVKVSYLLICSSNGRKLFQRPFFNHSTFGIPDALHYYEGIGVNFLYRIGQSANFQPCYNSK